MPGIAVVCVLCLGVGGGVGWLDDKHKNGISTKIPAVACKHY